MFSFHEYVIICVDSRDGSWSPDCTHAVETSLRWVELRWGDAPKWRLYRWVELRLEDAPEWRLYQRVEFRLGITSRTMRETSCRATLPRALPY